MSNLRITREKAHAAGTCCFCTQQVSEYGVSHHEPVTVVRGERTSLIVRFCDDCLRELRQAKP